jgi:hypothetical protein
VRAGLFVAGTAVAIIGAGVLLATLSFSTGPAVTHSDPVSVSGLPGHSYYTPELGGSNQSTATTHIVWAASGSLLVAVFPAVPCPDSKSVCASGTAVASWWANSGSWSAVGELSFPLFLNITNPNGTPQSFSGVLVESYTTSALTNPTWGLFIPLIGAIVLIAIGGVGIFLGLFLPEGVYGRRPIRPAEFDDLDDDELDEDDDADSAADGPGPPETPT